MSVLTYNWEPFNILGEYVTCYFYKLTFILMCYYPKFGIFEMSG